jgi:hypothetical protein
LHASIVIRDDRYGADDEAADDAGQNNHANPFNRILGVMKERFHGKVP